MNVKTKDDNKEIRKTNIWLFVAGGQHESFNINLKMLRVNGSSVYRGGMALSKHLC